jgi:hypothetical protein
MAGSPVPRAAIGPAGAPGGYRSYYTPELERLVGRLYANEIEQFSYRF